MKIVTYSFKNGKVPESFVNDGIVGYLIVFQWILRIGVLAFVLAHFMGLFK